MALDFPTAPIDGQTSPDGRYYFDSSVGDSGAWRSAPLPVGGLPAGSIIQWSSNTAPANWLVCDGAAVSRATFSSLFAVIGTTYGVGDGSTTFNLPDLRGRVAVGRDGSQTEFDVLGEIGGAKTHTLTTAEMPSHNHRQQRNSAGASSGSFVAGLTAPGFGDSVSAHQFTENTGGGGAHNNLQPYLVTNYIIKASSGWTAGDSELATRVGALEQPGRVLQVVSTTKTDTFTATQTVGNFTGAAISATITPKSAANKVLVMVQYNVNSNGASAVYSALYRGGSIVNYRGDAAGNRVRVAAATPGGGINLVPAYNGSIVYLDSPGTTSATTYDIRFSSSGNQTIFLNRGSTDSDTAEFGRAASSITLIEVLA
jgi:microcystin-dependent protein